MTPVAPTVGEAPLQAPSHSSIPPKSPNSSKHDLGRKTPSNHSEVFPTESGQLNKHLEFILACMGYAIGLGNVWRFPYITYRNGGGTFLIPFIIMFFFVGFPLFYIELFIGQYSGLGPVRAFSALGPIFSGLGLCNLIVLAFISLYYMVIVAWILCYAMVSSIGSLTWGTCSNAFNTDNCFSIHHDVVCRTNNTNSADDLTYFYRRCMSIKSICMEKQMIALNATHCGNSSYNEIWYKGFTRTLATEEFFSEYILAKGNATLDNLGELQWYMVALLSISWVLTFLCICQGIHSVGKVMYFTAFFPYVILTVFFIRAATLEGAIDGILFYILPNWEMLKNPTIWGDAASQAFYSFGVLSGSLVTLASYNDFYNNCHNDAVFVALANFLTPLYSGFAIFSVLGFQAFMMGVSVTDVTESGPGLAFVVYAEMLLQMPLPIFWSVVFFFMLFVMGIGWQLAGIKTINAAIIDHWPNLRGEWKVTATICLCFLLLEIPLCYRGGVYILTLLDWNVLTWGALILAIFECVAVAWSYGIMKALEDFIRMGMHPYLKRYWATIWSFVLPVGCFVTLVFVFTDWTKAHYGHYEFPLHAEIIGWLIGLSTLAPLPIFAVRAYLAGYRGKVFFKPTNAWKPSVHYHRHHPVPRLTSFRSKNVAQVIKYINVRYII